MKLNKTDFYFYLFSIFHIGSVLIGMTITSRMVLIKLNAYTQINITGGMLVIPVAFFIQDIVTEIYGYSNAKKMLHATILTFSAYVLGFCLIAQLPCGSSDQSCQDFSLISATFPRHALSFILSLAIGGTINNYILSKLKIAFHEKFLSLRFISSTAIGEAFFQFIACLISWYGTYSLGDILPIAFFSYAYKILFEIVSTPINLYVCHNLKLMKNEEIDYAF